MWPVASYITFHSKLIHELNSHNLWLSYQLQTYPSLATLELGDLPVNGLVYITFSDIRDADRAVTDIQRFQQSWRVSFTDPRKSALDSQSNSMMVKQGSTYEGQLLVTASSTKAAHQCDADTIIPIVKETLRPCGELMAFAVHTISRYGMVFRVEFYDVRSAENAFLNLNGVQIAVRIMTMAPIMLWLNLSDLYVDRQSLRAQRPNRHGTREPDWGSNHHWPGGFIAGEKFSTNGSQRPSAVSKCKSNRRTTLRSAQSSYALFYHSQGGCGATHSFTVERLSSRIWKFDSSFHAALERTV